MLRARCWPRQPLGLSWNVVPSLTASTTEQAAQLAAVCATATSQVDTYCQQPLRATIITETLTGPGHGRLTVDMSTGIGSLVTRRWPVAEVLAVQTSPARAFPPSWTRVEADQWTVRYPMLTSPAGPDTGPSGGSVVDLAPGVVSWVFGRGWWRVQHSYRSGWAHAGLTTMAPAGATTLVVDDVTGWDGAAGWIYDSTSTEAVTCTSADSQRRGAPPQRRWDRPRRTRNPHPHRPPHLRSRRRCGHHSPPQHRPPRRGAVRGGASH